jgi:hypothetical protein
VGWYAYRVDDIDCGLVALCRYLHRELAMVTMEVLA